MTDQSSKRGTDRRELRTTATPDQAWQAWANPEIIAGWFADRATGSAKPGSTITHIFEDFGIEMPYRVLEAIPGERIVFEGVGRGGQPFRQEITVRRDGGETVLELVHSGFDEGADFGEEFEGMDSGWKLALSILRHYLEHHYGKARTSYMCMRPAPVDFAKLDGLFRSRDGLAAWLTNGEGELGDAGSTATLALRNGDHVSGTVLAWSGRELAMTWPEIDGVLELKAFAAGPAGTMVGLRAFSWSDNPPAREAIDGWMSAALAALAEQLTAAT